jgi:hypothetical protein
MKRAFMFLASWLMIAVQLPSSSYALSAEDLYSRSLSYEVNGTQRELYSGRSALLVEVSSYSEGWSPLPNIPTEMDHLASVLHRRGFAVFRVRNPDADRLQRSIQTFLAHRATAGKGVLLVFAGHGWTDPDTQLGYVVPVNAPLPDNQRNQFYARALSMQRLRALVEESRARHTLFIFDSCFSGSIFTTRSAPSQPSAAGRHDADYFESLSQRSVQFFTSGSAYERVPSTSAFVPALIAAVEGRDGVDLDQNGLVTATEMAYWFRNRVRLPGQTPQFGDLGPIARDGFSFGPQVPPALFSLTGEAVDDGDSVGMEWWY